MMRQIFRCAMSAACIALVAILVSMLFFTSIRPMNHVQDMSVASQFSLFFDVNYLRLFIIPQYLCFFVLSFVSCLAGRALR